MALDAFLVITPSLGALPGGVQLAGTPSPDPQNLQGIAVEVSAFAFGVEDTTTIGPAGSGEGLGKSHNEPFTVVKSADSLSPSFATLVGLGARLAQVELYLRRPSPSGAGASPSANLAYTFREAVITDIAWSGSSGDDAPSERVTFRYQTLDEAAAVLPAQVATPTPSSTPTPTSTPTPPQTPTPTWTSMPTLGPTSTPTPTPAPTFTPTPTPTFTPTPTLTPTPTPTSTFTPTPTLTPTATPTSTPLPTSTPMPGQTPEIVAALPLAGALLRRHRQTPLPDPQKQDAQAERSDTAEPSDPRSDQEDLAD